VVDPLGEEFPGGGCCGSYRHALDDVRFAVAPVIERSEIAGWLVSAWSSVWCSA